MSDYPNKRDCEHGLLRGSCNLCDYEDDIKQLQAENEQLKK